MGQAGDVEGECMDEGVIGSDAWKRDKKLYLAVKNNLETIDAWER